MSLNFDAQEIELTCPKCSHKFKESIGRLKDDPQIPCPGCSAVIEINAKGLRDGLESADKAVADLKGQIGRLFK